MSEIEKEQRKALGIKQVNKPEYFPLSLYTLSAFRVMERSRNYMSVGDQLVPRPLTIENVLDYIEVYDTPCELWLFLECLFALDNIYIEDWGKKRAH
jgi:hypothetical protein